MKRTWIIPLALAVAACGDDAAGPTGDPLTRTEAIALAGSIVASGEGVTTDAGPAASADGTALSAVPIQFTQTIRTTHPCPAGGTVAFDLDVDGSVDEETGTYDLQLSGTQTHQGCVVPHQGGTLTITGAPNLQFAAAMSVAEFLPDAPFTFSVDGALEWASSDGRSGSCPVVIDAVTDFQARSRTVDALVCGHTVHETFTWQDPQG